MHRAFAAAGFDLEIREIVATDELVRAAPRVAKHRGCNVMVDVQGRRR